MNYSQKSKQKMDLTQIEIPNVGDFLNFSSFKMVADKENFLLVEFVTYVFNKTWPTHILESCLFSNSRLEYTSLWNSTDGYITKNTNTFSRVNTRTFSFCFLN